jgi:ElaB/YqjD/DUF883 family membrane-anchored ribosome-binding protein
VVVPNCRCGTAFTWQRNLPEDFVGIPTDWVRTIFSAAVILRTAPARPVGLRVRECSNGAEKEDEECAESARVVDRGARTFHRHIQDEFGADDKQKPNHSFAHGHKTPYPPEQPVISIRGQLTDVKEITILTQSSQFNGDTFYMENRSASEIEESTERLLRDLQNVVSDGEELLRAGVQDLSEKGVAARERLAAALEVAKETRRRLEERAVASAKATDKLVREYPYQSLGAAFGIGLLIGVLVNRR